MTSTFHFRGWRRINGPRLLLTADEAAFMADELREIVEAKEGFLRRLAAEGDGATFPH